MIAQAGAFQTDLLQRGKTVGDDAQFHLAFQRIQQETAPGSGAQISAIAFINASFSSPG
jgi:hypothetical protein